MIATKHRITHHVPQSSARTSISSKAQKSERAQCQLSVQPLFHREWRYYGTWLPTNTNEVLPCENAINDSWCIDLHGRTRHFIAHIVAWMARSHLPACAQSRARSWRHIMQPSEKHSLSYRPFRTSWLVLQLCLSNGAANSGSYGVSFNKSYRWL